MVVELKMSAISDVFNELLFGSGAWIGLIIVLVLCFGASYGLKHGSGIVFAIILVFLGIEYLNHVSVDSNFMWSVVICFISACFVTYQAITELRKGK